MHAEIVQKWTLEIHWRHWPHFMVCYSDLNVLMASVMTIKKAATVHPLVLLCMYYCIVPLWNHVLEKLLLYIPSYYTCTIVLCHCGHMLLDIHSPL